MKVKILLAAIVLLGFILRFYQLGKVPLSLYWDEASLGYNAYAIATTLHDEHGVFLPVSNFAAFGDYKPPGYIYATALAVKAWGLSEWSVRLPSALSGTLLVLVTFLLVWELSCLSHLRNLGTKTGLVAALFVAVSHWSLQMSRAAFEANLATLLSASGAWLFLAGRRVGSLRLLILAAVFLALSMYTFNSHRVFVPVLLLGLGVIFIKDILRSWRKYLVFSLVLGALLLPMLPHLLSTEGKLRFNEVAWINDLDLIEESNRGISRSGDSLLGKVVYNRRVIYTREFLRHYLDHFRPDYLFVSGDVNPRLSVRSFGEMYYLDLPLLLFGLWVLLKKRNKMSAVILFWLLAAPIPAALARETPHALRTLNILPIPMIISGLGGVYVLKLLKNLKLFKLGVAGVLGLLAFFYLRDYYLVYPFKFAGDWQYGYKQVVSAVKQRQGSYKAVSITNRLGRPYIYFLFYNQYPVSRYVDNRRAYKDSFGFWTVAGFDKYYFEPAVPVGREILSVRVPKEVPPGINILGRIYNPGGQAVFDIYESR